MLTVIQSFIHYKFQGFLKGKSLCYALKLFGKLAGLCGSELVWQRD